MPERSRHEESLKAARAAETAVSISEAVAAWTVQISDSSVGFMLVMREEGEEEGTKVLFMKRPVDWVYFVPFGAVRVVVRSAMLWYLEVEKSLRSCSGRDERV